MGWMIGGLGGIALAWRRMAAKRFRSRAARIMLGPRTFMPGMMISGALLWTHRRNVGEMGTRRRIG
jgi:hypothetical protein